MSFPSTRKLIATATVSGLAIAGGVLVFGQIRATANDSNPAVVQAVDADQAASFGVLRRERTEADAPPAAITELVNLSADEDLGANAALSRKAQTTESGTTLYVVPATGWICLATTSGVNTCNSAAGAQAGYLVGVEPIGVVAVRVNGLVPDGVSEVQLATADGQTTTATVVENTYAFERIGDGSDIVAIVFTDASGKHRVPLGGTDVP